MRLGDYQIIYINNKHLRERSQEDMRRYLGGKNRALLRNLRGVRRGK